VRPSATRGVVQTLPQLTPATEWAEVSAVPVLGTTISVRHEGTAKSTFTNSGTSTLKWQASFYGDHKTIEVDSREMNAASALDGTGNRYAFVEVEVSPNTKVAASAQ